MRTAIFNSCFKEDMQLFMEYRTATFAWNTYRLDNYRLSSFDRFLTKISYDKEIVSQTIDHVHLSVAIPPKLSVSNFMGYLKGKSTLMIYDRHPELQSKWDKAFWARGYYVETIGNITDEAVQKYIKEQAEESRKEDSRSTAL